MIYRESGQFKTNYADDMAMFPIAQDRWGLVAILIVAAVVVPLVASDYWLSSVLIPFLIFSLAALGLNLLTGYAGQLSLGHAGFMGVGAYAAYNLATRIPGMPLLWQFSWRRADHHRGRYAVWHCRRCALKGFYLAVATLAAQFIIEWAFSSIGWFSGGTATMTLDTPPMFFFGYRIHSPRERYYLTLGIVMLLTLLAKNLVRSQVGRSWMAIRDMDVAAEVMGIRLLPPNCWRLPSALSTPAWPGPYMPLCFSPRWTSPLLRWSARSCCCS